MPPSTGTAWRITTARFAAQAFSGEGARHYFTHIRIGEPQSLATAVRLLRYMGP